MPDPNSSSNIPQKAESVKQDSKIESPLNGDGKRSEYLKEPRLYCNHSESLKSDCPPAGQGVNAWVNKRVIYLLQKGMDWNDTFEIARRETANCGRDTTQDINHAIETGIPYLEALEELKETKKRRAKRNVQQTDVSEYLAKLPQILCINEKPYIYESESGRFRECAKGTIGKLLQQNFPNDFSATAAYKLRSVIYSILNWTNYEGELYPARRLESENPDDARTSDVLINVKNGVVRYSQIAKDGHAPGFVHPLEDHDPKWKFLNVLPVNCPQEAICPVYESNSRLKLPRVNGDDADWKMVRLIGAYCLLPDNRYNVQFFINGENNSGKSTTFRVAFQAVFGPTLASLTLHQLCPRDDKSFLPLLTGSLLNIGPEVDASKEIQDTSNLKKIITGERFTARQVWDKGGDQVSYAKLIWLMNELARLKGTKADWNRIRLIHFRFPTPDDKVDNSIEDTIKQERDGIFRLFLNSISELLEYKVFPHGSVESQKTYKQLVEVIDPFDHFCREWLEFGEGICFEVPGPKLHSAVREFLNDNDLDQTYDITRFIRNLRKLKGFGKRGGRTHEKAETKEGVKYLRGKFYTGIRLKH